MHFWSETERSTLRAAVDRARAGRPGLLVVEGAPGTGKTALLDELVATATDFRVLHADALESGDQTPFDLLEQWGSQVAELPQIRPMVLAQALRERLDEVGGDAPVLLRADDLQWADPESVEAVTWLLRRATGDRLLVAVATRPWASGVHDGLRRWASGPGNAWWLRLAGLTVTDARRLVAELRPEVTADVAERLWRHTGGNPLYLRALLREHDAEELRRTRMLPAPTEYAQLTARQVARVPAASAELLRAVCVLGSGWLSLYDAAAVADVAEPGDAAAALADAGLVREQWPDGGPWVRVAHALTRSAVYQSTPPSRRRLLHLRAAGTTTDRATSLEHRIAAAEHYDDVLADELSRFAGELHDARSHRLAARYHRSAAALSSDPSVRERRRLEAVLDALLGQDTDLSTADRQLLTSAADTPERTVVQAALEIVLGRWDVALGLLDPVPAALDDPAGVRPLTAYRHLVLLAWAGIGAGATTAAVASALQRAAAIGVEDPALAGYAASPGFYVLERTQGLSGAAALFADLPEDPASAPPEQTVTVAGRGVLRLRSGLLEPATRDLAEVHRRFSNGEVDIADGAYIARLGQAHWWRGRWDQARAAYETAVDAGSGRFLQPIVAAAVSLLPSTEGRFARADELLDQARDFHRRKPWEEAGRMLMVAEVVRLHAGADPDARRGYVRSQQALFDRFTASRGNGLVELLHAALAAAWAGDADLGGWALTSIERLPLLPDWSGAVRDWLRGLLEEATGRDPAVAAASLRRAAGAPSAEVPLYRAHLLVDHARIAARAGRTDVAERAGREAAELYRTLGAAPYLEAGRSGEPVGAAPRPVKDAWAMTDREREVLALVLNGLSYAQIARELFITQSTVAFHLSNLYAKTGVTSRHQLTAMVRGDPASFGMLGVPA
ncbi:LuxR C-terminal-related transcriptional regulator [Nakamurella endophytica]|uniref:LuxR family transcriptional regulator n=1 Tax=Nakamurella endophytica TaxID=1748367 RepID=A0A917TDY7_9ACTN|nr:LuxR family transcriptional regulator [Nakamurella endophytica]GGM19182.1 LuxR family transcriptional regulator [Nakamurella endophytica]